MRSALVLALVVAASSVTPLSPATAQGRAAPVTLDATLGGGWGAGGPQVRGRGFVAADAAVATRFRLSGDGTLVGALATGLQLPPPHGDDCVLDGTPGGGCLPDYPAFISLGVLVGWEQRGIRGNARWLSTRVMAGPAYYRVNLDEQPERTRGALGLQGRVDLAVPARSHVAFVTSLRGALVPDVRNDAYLTRTIGVGLRVQ